MKRKSLLFLLLMALFAPLAMTAQNTVTVCDGTTTNSNIPVYGYSGDTQGTTSEFVIPATTEGMSSMRGMAITGMQFYVSSAAGAAWTATFQVYMTEIDETTLSSTTGPSNCTVVYTGTLDATGTTMDVVFDEGYTYNGGNLLIGTYIQTAGNWKSASFYGIEATGAAYQSGGYNQNGAKNFLPKTTFTYSTPSSCAKPTDLAVEYTEGENTATISWRSDARNFNIDVNGTITAIRENPYTLRGVEPATTYDIKVQADCGDEQSAWATTSFFSGCTGISVPYTYGFEDAAALDCWTVSATGSYASVTGITTNLPRTGSNCFWFYYTTTPGQYLISPAIGGFTNGLHVEFWYRGYDNGVETFQVGYSTTDNDPASFIFGDEITAPTTYTQFKANYPAETKYVAVKHTSDDQYYLFLDDFLFEESASCLEPSSVHVADITTTGAIISWTAGASETAWDIFVTDDATIEPDDTTTPTVAGTEDNPYSLTDLTPATIYYVYVRAICGEDEASAWSSYAVFNTECEAMSLPYSYGFEDATLPVCWNTIIENTSYTGINIMAISDTDNVLAFYMGTYQNPALVAVLPEVDATYPLNQYQITFDACYANTSSSSMTAGKLGIGIMTDPTDFTTFELIEEVDITDGYSTFGTHNVWFNSYTGEGRYIAIRDIYTQGGYVLVDNIEVTELPSCLQVTELGASNIGDTSAELSWTANNGETEWTIYYKAEGADEYTEVANVTENPYTLEGLTAATNYEFYVVANCSETAQSTASEVYSFATALCALADQCEITYALTDSYGDGWNGNAINVVDANTEEVLATWTIASGSSASGSLSICNGRQIEIQYVLGSGSNTYPSENSFVITDHLDNVIWEVSGCSSSTGSVTHVVDCSVPTCLKPTELAATTTATSAVLSWTANSEETAWTLYWKENGAEEYTEVAVTENPYTLSGLTANTAYEFYVIANCSADDTSDASAVYEFATPCDVITVAEGSAYTYDFENELPWSCWTNVAGNNNLTTGNNNTTDGNYKLQFAGTTTGNIVAMPAFTPAINGLMLTFWTRPEGYSYSSCGTFSVGYMTDLNDASSFVAVDTYSYNDWTSNTYVEKTATFTDAPAGAYIAFCQNAGSSYYYWFVDDVEVSLMPTFTLDIEGYGDDSNPGGYYLIASPVGNINPENVGNMTANDFDLYRFNQEAEYEWENWKQEGDNYHFDLEAGKGYLYANSEDVTLSFTGIPVEGDTYDVPLTKNDEYEFAGWNLVGNPFTQTAYVNEHDFYTMNGDGSEIISVARTNYGVEPMQAIFVIAETDGEQLTFSTTEPAKSSLVALNLSNSRGIIDRAVVRFGEGRQLPKFQLNSNSTKLYIPMDNIDYAVVRSEEVGEMPVNFKAENDGNYTISISSEEVNFGYLHLIDNMTGTDVDLLATPSYSFAARTNDYANRFKLVYATGTLSVSENFAFFNNGNFVINNEGNATLQVIDLNGHILSSETINGCANVNVNAAAGVYMIRLVNGENVMIQKVIVK